MMKCAELTHDLTIYIIFAIVPEVNINHINRNRIRAARLIAIMADFLQIGLFPIFGEGFISPLNDALDCAVCLILTILVGWHFAFLPSFLVELMPIADVIPSWTI